MSGQPAFRRRRLRNRIIAWSFIPTAVILFAIALVNFYTSQQVTEALVFERDLELTHLSAGLLSLQLSQEPDILALVRAWDIYKNNPSFRSLVINRVGGIITLRAGKSGAAYLVDATGRVIYHSDPALVGSDFAAQVPVQEVLAGREGTIRTYDLDGREVVASFSPIPGTLWGLVNQESWATLSAPSRGYQQLLFVLLALGLLVPAVVITIGVRRITRPIASLIDAAQKVARGNFDQRISVATGDELDELAEQFNRMAATLQESYTHLEQRVADRTRELAALNAIATSVSEALDLDTTLNRTLDRILNLLELEIGQIRLSDQEGRLTVRTQRGEQPQAFSVAGRGVTEEDALHAQVVRSGEPLVVESVLATPGYRWAEEAGLLMLAIFPLRAKERVLGTLALASRQWPRRFTTEERELLRAVSDQVGVAIENAYLHEEARQRAIMEERNRLARELHDSVTQSLYGVNLYAEAAARTLASGQVGVATTYLSELRETAREALQEMRLLIFELRPPVLEREGLVAALQARLEAVESRGEVETELLVEGEGRLPGEIEEVLYRIAQEALNNVLKHAQAHHIVVRLHQGPDGAMLEVCDDGVGFDPDAARQPGSLGLCGMQERAQSIGGELELETTPGQGTRVRVRIGGIP
jgi:nitrate/nitrite-specific signal transduction histidine kinase